MKYNFAGYSFNDLAEADLRTKIEDFNQSRFLMLDAEDLNYDQFDVENTVSFVRYMDAHKDTFSNIDSLTIDLTHPGLLLNKGIAGLNPEQIGKGFKLSAEDFDNFADPIQYRSIDTAAVMPQVNKLNSYFELYDEKYIQLKALYADQEDGTKEKAGTIDEMSMAAYKRFVFAKSIYWNLKLLAQHDPLNPKLQQAVSDALMRMDKNLAPPRYSLME